MKARHIVSLLVAISASLAAPAFASGYGPAPFYNPQVGAPASQHGQGLQTLDEHSDTTDAQRAYGGVISEHSQSGRPTPVRAGDNLFAHH
jgi:hypothetical protein